jgi:hypothetical protein
MLKRWYKGIRYRDWSGTADSLRQFFSSYHKSYYSWVSTFFTALFGLLVPGNLPLYARAIIVLVIFGLPLLVYYQSNVPFGLQCEYSSYESSPNVLTREQNIVQLDSGENEVYFDVTVGGTIEEYGIVFDPPPDFDIYLYDKPVKHHSFKNNTFSSPVRKPTVFTLCLTVDTGNSGLSPSRSYKMQVTDRESTRSLDEVEFVPQ